jgi:hypothetical protein
MEYSFDRREGDYTELTPECENNHQRQGECKNSKQTGQKKDIEL